MRRAANQARIFRQGFCHSRPDLNGWKVEIDRDENAAENVAPRAYQRKIKWMDLDSRNRSNRIKFPGITTQKP